MKKIYDSKPILGVRIDKETKNTLIQLAKKEGISTSKLTVRAILELIKRDTNET